MTTPTLLFLLALISSGSAFSVKYSGSPAERDPFIVQRESTSNHDLSFNSLDDYLPVNLERAKQCADHFGECSVEEMEALRNNLHRERLQTFIGGGFTMRKPSEDTLEHLLLEEELDLQLALLKRETPESTLFPHVGESMDSLPHLKEGNEHLKSAAVPEKKGSASLENAIYKAEVDLAIEETILGHRTESVAEAVMMCSAVLAFIMLPQFV